MLAILALLAPIFSLVTSKHLLIKTIETNDFDVSLAVEEKDVPSPFSLCWECFVPEVEIVAVEFQAECTFEWDASLLVVDSEIYIEKKERVE